MDAHVVLTALWWCVKPSTVAPVTLLLGIGLVLFGRRRVGVVALAVSGFVLVNALILPTARVLTTAIERRVEPVAEPTVVDGIIVLGGNGAVRLPPFAELASRYLDATLVFSGGGGEAMSARRYLSGFDGLAERTLYEERSRNTFENARFSYALVQPAVGEVWVLVTSAIHMPRAAETFSDFGWPVVPYPVGFCDPPCEVVGITRRLGHLDGVVRELLATVASELASVAAETAL